MLLSAGRRLPPAIVDSWVRPCRLLALEGDHLRIAAPNQFSRNWLVEQMRVLTDDASDADRPYLKEAGLTLALLLQPFAPHISEELWTSLGGQGSAVRQAWPTASPRWLQEEQVEIPVQVNGRLRARLLVAPSISETEALSRAQEDARVSAHLQGRAIRKTIYLPGKLLNIVVG